MKSLVDEEIALLKLEEQVDFFEASGMVRKELKLSGGDTMVYYEDDAGRLLHPEEVEELSDHEIAGLGLKDIEESRLYGWI